MSKHVDNHLDGRPRNSHHLMEGEGAMTDLIEFVCREHTESHAAGPLVTPVEGAWAYCAGHGPAGHRWSRIEPTSREILEHGAQLQESRAS